MENPFWVWAEMPSSDLVFLGQSPVCVDASYLWEGQLKEPLFWLVQEADTFPIYGNNKVVLGQAGTWKCRKNLSMLYKSFSIDLISVFCSQAPEITWKLSDFKESGKKQRPLKASKIYKLFLHSLTGQTVLRVWSLQYKKICKVFSVKSGLRDLQTMKSRPDPRGSLLSSAVTVVKGNWRKSNQEQPPGSQATCSWGCPQACGFQISLKFPLTDLFRI